MQTHQDVRVRELEAELERKDALLREIDHRVKNHLQLISSLGLLQSRRTHDEGARRALKTMLERVNAVAAVHRRLLHGDGCQRFDAADFIRDLTGDLALAAGRDDVRIILDLAPLTIPASMAAPFALVLNELMGNALKHAFPGRAGVITVSMSQAGNAFTLTVADDGCGMTKTQAGFGLHIVELLCRQLRAELEIEHNAPGVRAVVRTPLSA